MVEQFSFSRWSRQQNKKGCVELSFWIVPLLFYKKVLSNNMFFGKLCSLFLLFIYHFDVVSVIPW